ncbi:MAG: VTT domain-containing protein [Nanoarchaeota archaeon]
MALPLVSSLPSLIALLLLVFTGSLGVPGATIGIITYSTTLIDSNLIILTMVLVYLMAVAGDILSYELALFFSERFRYKLRKFRFFRDNEEKAGSLLKRYEFSLVFFTRFAFTSLCSVVSYLSGFERVSRKKFFFAVFTGEALFAMIYVLIGVLIGEIFTKWIKIVNRSAVAIVLLFVVIYLIGYLARKRKN